MMYTITLLDTEDNILQEESDFYTPYEAIAQVADKPDAPDWTAIRIVFVDEA